MLKQRKLFKISAPVLIILISVVCSSYAQTTEEETLRKGVDLARHEKLDEALAEFNKVIAADPKSANAYYNMGFAYDKKGDTAKAISNFSKAIEIDPTLADAYYNRGFAYYKKGNFDEAIADYNKVIEVAPDSADAYYGLGLVYSQKGDLDKAILEYTEAIKVRPTFALAYDARAVAHVTKKNYISALADVNKAQSLGFRSRPLKRVPAGLTVAIAEKTSAKIPDNASPQPRQAQTTALRIAALIFLIMSIAQFIRVITKAKIVVNDRIGIPLWISMIVSPVMFLLAIYMFIAAR